MSVTRPLERVPPQNLEAEQSVLGSMLLDRDAIAQVVESLRPEDFYRDLHRTIFVAMLELFERGEPVDLITLTNKLTTIGKIEDVGGASYLASLPNTVPTASNAEYYAAIVLEKSMLRALIYAGTHIASLGYEGIDEVSALIDQAEKLVYGISARRNMQDFQTIKEILKASFEKIDKRYQEKGTVTGLATGFTDLDMLTSGLQPADMVIVAARPSVGKCLSYDSRITLEDGSVATIEEIYRRRRARLFTLGNDWKLKVTEPSAFVDDGVKLVFKVTTRLGRTVECTAIHPFLTLQGWLPLAALRVGERIAVPRKIGAFGSTPMRECEIKLLAYFIGDGSLIGNKAAFANTDPRIIDDFFSAVRDFGAVRCRRERDRSGWRAPSAIRRNSKNAVVIWLLRHRLWGKGARRKEIPTAVFTLPCDQLALFLNRLFATDGWAAAGPKLCQIGYGTTSARLASQIQHLLLRFGIIASLRRRRALYKEAARRAWQLEITDPASIRTFSGTIGMFSKESRLQAVLSTIEARGRKPNTDTIPVGIWRSIAAAKGEESWAALARRAQLPGTSNIHAGRRGLSRHRLGAIAEGLRAHELECLSGSDVYWDEVASIKPTGLKQVYDLTIPETHNFVANDICVHNTTFALNISQHAAINNKIPVAIFSLETSKEQLVQRILCSEARVENTKLRTGYLADEDWRKLARAMGSLSEAPIFIDDSATLSVMEMRAKARKLKAEHGLGLIVVDYIQLIQSFKRTENRTQELSEIARGIKSLAKELDLPVIAISQLSRAVETMGSKRPMLSHLRECVTGDTTVWDADSGRRYTIAELARANRWPRLLSLERTGKLIPIRPTAVIEKGDNDVFEIRTTTGRCLRATAEHPVLTPEGWRKVTELRPRGLIAAACASELTGKRAKPWIDRLPYSATEELREFKTGAGLRWRKLGFRLQSQKTLDRPTALALAERLNAKSISQLASSELLWDRVVSVTPAGRSPVYDLTMPGTHNFVANGLVVHNSGEIEQVSDLVAFLYREDYYDVEKAQKDNKENVCELIIAKHRNGPIGSVELYFHKEFSRFANLDKRR